MCALPLCSSLLTALLSWCIQLGRLFTLGSLCNADLSSIMCNFLTLQIFSKFDPYDEIKICKVLSREVHGIWV